MCQWSASALFHCDGTVQRQKHLCKLVPEIDPTTGRSRAGVEIYHNHDRPASSISPSASTHPSGCPSSLLGCKHSETKRHELKEAFYIHVCDRNRSRPGAHGPEQPSSGDRRGDCVSDMNDSWHDDNQRVDGERLKPAKINRTWKPVIKQKDPFDMFVINYTPPSSSPPLGDTYTTRGATTTVKSMTNDITRLSNSLLFHWCDGRFCTIDDVYGDDDGEEAINPKTNPGSDNKASSAVKDLAFDRSREAAKRFGGFGWQGIDLLTLGPRDQARLVGWGTVKYWEWVWSGGVEREEEQEERERKRKRQEIEDAEAETEAETETLNFSGYNGLLIASNRI